MTPETIAIIKTAVMCIQTIVFAVVCVMVVKFFRDGHLEAARENKRKRERLDRLFRAMDTERDAVLDDLARQADEIIKSPEPLT